MIQNKLISTFLFLLAAGFIISCEDNSTGANNTPEITVNLVEDLNADAETNDGHFTFYNLRTNAIVAASDSGSTNWDIAFNGTAIIVNGGSDGPGSGGAVMLDVPFDQVTVAPSTGYETEAAFDGWFNYTGQAGNPQHAVLPTEDSTIIVKTADGNHYAKIQIMSYYEGNPDTSTDTFVNLGTRPASRYFTFNYAIQTEAGVRELTQ